MPTKFNRAVFWCVALLVLVSALIEKVPELLTPTSWDKSNHFLAFVVLALLGRRAYRQHWRAVLVGLLAYGGLIEVLQTLTPTRSGEWGDLLADAVALGVTALLVQVIDRYPSEQLRGFVLGLPRPVKRIVALSADAGICVFTAWLALCLMASKFVTLTGAYWWTVAVALVVALPLFVVTGLYRTIFRYTDGAALAAVWRACVIYGLLYGSVFTVLGVDGIPRAVGVVQPLLLLGAVIAARMVARDWLGGAYRQLVASSSDDSPLPKAMIYGAGAAGQQLALALAQTRDSTLQVVGFFDDDQRLHGGVIRGLPVFSPDRLESIVHESRVSTILLALPSSSRRRRNEILDVLLAARVTVRTLPGLNDLASGRAQVDQLRDLEIEDLLGRDVVPPIEVLFNKNILGKVVMVTGAGGSIGSELCRQIVQSMPDTLLLVERSEFALYSIHHELLQQLAHREGYKPRVVPLLATVFDERRMREIMRTWRPSTVYHAAAYKHVPMVEHNVAEGLRNNVIGTWVMARVAQAQGVKDFVLISTDKAVRPTNVMGASKRLAEMVLQAMAADLAKSALSAKLTLSATLAQPAVTRFSMVRFGNVLGSSGSVVPLFRKQIREGGPITLTHPEITRYFMTIPEAAQLVIQAGAMGSGGDVFVLDMGEPVKIADLARRMVELSGHTVRDQNRPDGDIEIQVTGLRPAEKLYEELLIGNKPLPTQHPRIMKAHEDFLAWDLLETDLHTLNHLLKVDDLPAMLALLRSLVVDYRPDGKVVDWVHLARDMEERQTARIEELARHRRPAPSPSTPSFDPPSIWAPVTARGAEALKNPAAM
jgi:FlaA1/EpsC-like NDP-sugar epimerase/VanZ family protein